MSCGTRKLLYMVIMLDIYDDRSQILQPHIYYLPSVAYIVDRQTRILQLYVVYSASHVCVQWKELTLIMW